MRCVQQWKMKDLDDNQAAGLINDRVAENTGCGQRAGKGE